MIEYLEKTCPFCDGKVFVEQQTLSPYVNHVVFICSGCGMKFEYTHNFYTYTKRGMFACDDALIRVAQNPSPLEIWNTRKPIERVVKRLEEEKGTYIDENGKELFQEDYFIDIDDTIKIVKEEMK